MNLIKWLIAMAVFFVAAAAAIAGVVLLPHPGGLVLYCAGLAVMLAVIACIDTGIREHERLERKRKWRAHAREVIKRWSERRQ